MEFRGRQQYYTPGIGSTRIPMSIYRQSNNRIGIFPEYHGQEPEIRCYSYDELDQICETDARREVLAGRA